MKVKAIWEFDADVSDISPEHVDVEGYAKDLAKNELSWLMGLNGKLIVDDFQFEVVKEPTEDERGLYYIRNIGCDDETCGLARISDEDFPKFKEIIENLNKNSTYGCMPKIEAYKIFEGLIRRYDGEISDYTNLHLDGRVYILTTGSIYNYKKP